MILAAALLADSPKMFRQHLQHSVHVLQARGIPLLHLHEMLDRLLQLTMSGGLPASGRDLIADLITSGHAWIESEQGIAPAPYVSPQQPGPYAFFQAILHGKRPDALRIVNEALDDGQPVMRISTDLLQSSLYEVGRLWELHQINVGREHMATAAAELAFSQLALRAGPHPGFRPRGHAVVMGLEREPHRFGGQMVAAFLEARGWEIRYLGTALPTGAVLASLREQKPRLLCISLSLPAGLPTLSQMLREIRADVEFKPMKVLVGGQAFQVAPDAGEQVGADASTPSLEQGLERIEEWKL